MVDLHLYLGTVDNCGGSVRREASSQAAQLQVFSGPTGAVVLRFPQDERLPSWDGRPRDVRQVVGGPKGGRLPPAGPAAGTCAELSGRSGKRDCDNQEVKKKRTLPVHKSKIVTAGTSARTDRAGAGVAASFAA